MLHDITNKKQAIYTGFLFSRYLVTCIPQRAVKNVEGDDKRAGGSEFYRRLTMTKGSNFWVIGGEFGSMNFHKLVEGSAQVQGPFKTRKEAEDAWRVVSEENRHKAGVRFSIVEEPSRVSA
jgi:hypothetical protein